MTINKLSPSDALRALSDKQTFIEMFKHESLSIEFYKPTLIDKQTPHSRDELYVIISGSGNFLVDGDKETVETGDVLFVAAGKEHQFVDFSDDFSTWVFFYGPEGGEESI